MTAIRPLFDRIIIERDDSPAKVGALFVPEKAKGKQARGIILAAGPGRVSSNGGLTPLNVQAGDHVAFNHRAGTEVVLKGQTCLLLRESDVLGVLDD